MSADGLDMDRVHQRTVSARGAPAVVTAAARSVFDVARDVAKAKRATKKPPPELDIDAIKVEKGIAIPDARAGKRGGRYDSLLLRLAVGMSAALPVAHKASLCSAASGWAKRHAGTKFTVRIVSETDVRIWRTA